MLLAIHPHILICIIPGGSRAALHGIQAALHGIHRASLLIPLFIILLNSLS